MQTSGAESTEDDGAVSARARRLVIAGLMLALMLPSLDLLVVSTAGKAIADDIGKLSQLSWLFISYQLTLVAFMPLFGKLGDIYGRKRTIQSSIVLFVVASVFTGLATNFPMLVLGRALQGVGGGGISGLSQAVIADIVPPRHRGRYAWITPTVFTVVSMLGPLLGGLFVDHLSWRWIFFINLPLGIIAWFFIAVAFQVPVNRVRHQVDLFGALLLVVAVSAIVFAASTAGEQFAWTSPVIIGMTAGGLAVGAFFVLFETRTAEPVFPLKLLRDPLIRVCTATTFFIGSANFGLAIFLPLFLQVVSGASATQAGFSLMPTSIGIIISSAIVGRSISKNGRYRWYPLIGMIIFSGAIFQISLLNRGSPQWHAWVATFLTGVGSGTASPVLMVAVQNSVRHDDVGVASSLAMFCRTMGQVLGPAFATTLWITRFDTNVRRLVPADTLATLDIEDLRNNSETIKGLAEPTHTQVVESLRLGINSTFRFAAALSAVGIITSLFMQSRPLRGTIRESSTSDQAVAPARTP
jgi:EmrB/QacA subfamily drug resistance transporter